MAKNGTKKLTPLEAMIMDAVWDLSEATVREVREHLAGEKDMAYNTVLTMLRILRDKGYLESRREGRSDVYRPAVQREQVAASSLKELLERFFGGSPRALVSHLIEEENLSAKEIRAIRREVDDRLAK